MLRPVVVRLRNWIGDVVLGLPALELLGAHGYAPQLVGKPWAPMLLSGHDWPVVALAATFSERVEQWRALRRRCEAADPGFAGRLNTLLMPNSFSSALETRLAGLRAAGHAYDGRSLLLARRLPRTSAPHAMDWFWNQACQWLGVHASAPTRSDLRVSSQALDAAQALVAAHGWRDGFICIAPFAKGTVHKLPKKWPLFPAFVEQLGRSGLPIVVCPGPGEAAEARESYPSAVRLEQLPLDTYAALLGLSRLVVANDTGPAHLAAARRAPLLSVLGPTPVDEWAPRGPTVTVLSAYPQWPQFDEVLHAAHRTLALA